MVKIVNADNFDEAINLETSVVDFYADWCGPCKMLAPVFENISENFPNTQFNKLNIDDNTDIAKKYNVRSIPAIAVFKNGELVEMQVGFSGQEDLETFLKKHLD